MSLWRNFPAVRGDSAQQFIQGPLSSSGPSPELPSSLSPPEMSPLRPASLPRWPGDATGVHGESFTVNLSLQTTIRNITELSFVEVPRPRGA